MGHRSLPVVHWISTYAKIRWRLGLKPQLRPPARAAAAPPMTVRLAVPALRRRATLQNFIDQIADGSLDASVEVVVASNRARRLGSSGAQGRRPVEFVERRRYDSIEAFSEAITQCSTATRSTSSCWRASCGSTSSRRGSRGACSTSIPACCRKYGGLGMYGHHVHEAVLAAGETESGCTGDHRRPRVRPRPIVLQKSVPVLPGDTPDTLAERVFEAECEAYPEAVRLFAAGQIPAC